MEKEETPQPEIHLVTVITVNDLMEAELIQNTLRDHGINCELDGERQAGFTGTLGIGILVRESDAEKAMEFIQIHHPR